jgi:hypothetical protein
LHNNSITESKHESEDADLALAMQLQDEENKRNPPPSKNVPQYPEELKHKNKKDHCIIQ